MLQRLCLRLRPFKVFVHIDAKVDITPFVEACRDLEDNVTFIGSRVPVRWAGYSQVQAMINLMNAALTTAAPDEHLVMLSGQDYPIKPIEKLHDFLCDNDNKQFINSFEIKGTEEKYEKQVRRRHHRDVVFLDGRGATRRRLRNGLIRCMEFLDFRTMPSRPSYLSVVAHGATHWALTAKCAADLLAAIDPATEKYFSSVFAPDEKVFHSLVASTQWRLHMYGGGLSPYVGPGNYRYVNFHEISPSHAVRGLPDWPVVLASDKYFIRKVVTGQSDALIERIEKELL